MIKQAIQAMTRPTPDRSTEQAAQQLMKGDRTSTLKLFKAGVYDSILFDSEDGTRNSSNDD